MNSNMLVEQAIRDCLRSEFPGALDGWDFSTTDENDVAVAFVYRIGKRSSTRFKIKLPSDLMEACSLMVTKVRERKVDASEQEFRRSQGELSRV